MVGREYENRGLARDGAKMVMAVANAQVPKFTVIIGSSFGAGNYGMCGRGVRPAPTVDVAQRANQRDGRPQAASVLLQVRLDNLQRDGRDLSHAEREAFTAPTLAAYEAEGNPYFSTARLWDDGVIDPVDTRMVLGLGISAALNAEIPATPFGVFRM